MPQLENSIRNVNGIRAALKLKICDSDIASSKGGGIQFKRWASAPCGFGSLHMAMNATDMDAMLANARAWPLDQVSDVIVHRSGAEYRVAHRLHAGTRRRVDC